MCCCHCLRCIQIIFRDQVKASEASAQRFRGRFATVPCLRGFNFAAPLTNEGSFEARLRPCNSVFESNWVESNLDSKKFDQTLAHLTRTLTFLKPTFLQHCGTFFGSSRPETRLFNESGMSSLRRLWLHALDREDLRRFNNLNEST